MHFSDSTFIRTSFAPIFSGAEMNFSSAILEKFHYYVCKFALYLVQIFHHDFKFYAGTALSILDEFSEQHQHSSIKQSTIPNAQLKLFWCK